MLSAKQWNYWYHFNNVFGMTRSLTGDWTGDLEASILPLGYRGGGLWHIKRHPSVCFSTSYTRMFEINSHTQMLTTCSNRIMCFVLLPLMSLFRRCSLGSTEFGLVLTIFNEGAYLTCKSIFHKALNLFKLFCDIALESVPWTNQY